MCEVGRLVRREVDLRDGPQLMASGGHGKELPDHHQWPRRPVDPASGGQHKRRRREQGRAYRSKHSDDPLNIAKSILVTLYCRSQ